VAKTIEVISPGVLGSHSGSLQLVIRNMFYHFIFVISMLLLCWNYV
jgi:hypothetical protein